MIRPFNDNQITAINFSLDRDHSMWFMPPGMGKTLAWLEVIAQTQLRTLIVAPKLVCMNTWPRENKKWGYNFPMRFLHGPNKHLRGSEQVSLINYEGLPWLAEQIKKHGCKWDQVIFDEVSKLKSVTSQRFNAWIGVNTQFKSRLGGTGTPVGAHLADLFGEMYVVDNGESLGTDYEMFTRKHFYYNEYDYTLDPYSDTEEVLLDAIRDTAVSFDINDLNMPELQHIPVTLELPDNCVEHYNEMKETSVIEHLDLLAVNAAVRSGKLRQIASGSVKTTLDGPAVKLHNAKADELKRICEEHDGRPVMIFFEYRSDYDSICESLGYRVPALYGGTKTKDANTYVKKWNAGALPHIAMHPRSAAYGLNMQDSGNVIVWYTVPWSYEMVNQGTARIWRQGQKHNVMCYYLLVDNTEDMKVYARVTEREATHTRVMQGLTVNPL